MQEKAQPCASLWRKTSESVFLQSTLQSLTMCVCLYITYFLGSYQPLCEFSWRKSPWFRKPCHTPLSKSRSPFSWVCCARMGLVFKTRCHVPWASAALGRPSYSSFKQAIMPQHGRSPDNRLANLSLASPTSKVASTVGPPSRQRSPKSERPSIPCIYPHSVLSPKPFVSCCSSLPYCPSSEVFSSIYCDSFQFLAILCCLLFF